jgi:hypothetical protein
LTLINVRAATEEKEEEIKDEFYAQLSEINDRQPGHDIKIVLGDFSAKIGREDVYQSVAGKGSLHEFCNNNGWRHKFRHNGEHESKKKVKQYRYTPWRRLGGRGGIAPTHSRPRH